MKSARDLLRTDCRKAGHDFNSTITLKQPEVRAITFAKQHSVIGNRIGFWRSTSPQLCAVHAREPLRRPIRAIPVPIRMHNECGIKDFLGTSFSLMDAILLCRNHLSVRGLSRSPKSNESQFPQSAIRNPQSAILCAPLCVRIIRVATFALQSRALFSNQTISPARLMRDH